MKTGTEPYVTSLLLTKRTKAGTLKLMEDSERNFCDQSLEK